MFEWKGKNRKHPSVIFALEEWKGKKRKKPWERKTDRKREKEESKKKKKERKGRGLKEKERKKGFKKATRLNWNWIWGFIHGIKTNLAEDRFLPCQQMLLPRSLTRIPLVYFSIKQSIFFVLFFSFYFLLKLLLLLLLLLFFLTLLPQTTHIYTHEILSLSRKQT